MTEMTKQDVLDKAKELDVKFIRMQFVDILGIIKNVAITVEQLSTALEGEIMFDGSSIEGFTRVNESDMYLKPDYDTFTVFPWRPSEGGTVARLMCDIYTPDGKPFSGCPRTVLKNVIKEAEELGYKVYAGPEPEFFLFELDQKGNPTTQTQDQGGYFDLAPVDQGVNARRDIVLALEKMNFDVEASHHEVASGQHEIDFKYTPILRTADNIATFRFVTKTIARKHDLHATFMPKPIYNESGSGMHVHQSIYKNGDNLFYQPEDELQLSQKAYNYIGGILKHAPAMTAITNPTINSYKRLVPGYEAPVYICWSTQNRSALVRIPSARGNSTRVEIRNPDPSANPYLAMAVTLKAGLAGIKNEIDPGQQSTSNIYDMDETERNNKGIGKLPGDINEAINFLKEDSVIKEILGEHIVKHFIEAKNIEWNAYKSQVHQWELESYLRIY